MIIFVLFFYLSRWKQFDLLFFVLPEKGKSIIFHNKPKKKRKKIMRIHKIKTKLFNSHSVLLFTSIISNFSTISSIKYKRETWGKKWKHMLNLREKEKYRKQLKRTRNTRRQGNCKTNKRENIQTCYYIIKTKKKINNMCKTM